MSAKYRVWIKERLEHEPSRYHWVENGDGPMGPKTAERVAREITQDTGVPAVVKPAELTWIERNFWA